MGKIGLIGDSHGNDFFLRRAMELISGTGGTKAVQLGDFGVGDWGQPGRGERFLDHVADIVEDEGIPLYFIDGNHEDFDSIDGWFDIHEPNDDGHLEIRPNLFYIPRGSFWTWYNKNWFAMGGAYSIDKEYRIEGISWWARETPTMAEMEKGVENVAGRPVDVMIAHDAMAETPWDRPLIPIQASLQVRQDLSVLVREVQPKTYFHGHYHWNIDWTHPTYGTQVHGLGYEGSRGSVGLLDGLDYRVLL